VTIQRDTKQRLAGIVTTAIVRYARFLAVLALAVGSVTLWSSSAAYAVAILEINGTQITDNGAGDSNPLLGAVTFNGSIDNFIVNVTTGVSQPLIGSPHQAFIDLNSVNVILSGASLLTISFTDTNFSLPFESNVSTNLVGGTLAAPSGSEVAFQSYLDNSNSPFGTEILLSSFIFGPGAFSGSSSTGVTTNNPFSLTQVATLNFTGPGIVSFDAASHAAVPEPTSLVLLGSGMAGLGLLSRKRAQVCKA
jgi:hypothetical protein